MIGKTSKQAKSICHAVLSLQLGESLTADQSRTAVRKRTTSLGVHKYLVVMHQDDSQHLRINARGDQ